MEDFLNGLWPILVAVVVIIIGLYLISKLGKGKSSNTGLNISSKEILNFSWMLISYILVLWAFKILWPNVWSAWSGQRFFVSQLLFISTIGFLASKWIRDKELRWIALVTGLLAILLVISSVNIAKKNNSSNPNNITISKDNDVWSPTIPKIVADTLWTNDTLRKAGDVYTHKIQYGYHFHTFSDKLIDYQPNGEEKEEVGNGKGYSKELNDTRIITISFYKEPVIVHCLMVKNGKCPYDNI
ncbi:MAG: hypothetical protein KGI58_03490 [Patescibacteria group bacterium]|nr:hypothetical protein [Patescibacteria group bacterium]